MTKSTPFAHMIPSQGLRWVLLVALLVSGLLGNYFKYPLFFEIDFLFGSIFSFLILQFFGRAYGIGAALLVSVVTYFIWGHPYAMIIMTAELAFVALLTGRYKISLVFADATYWVLLGMPMVYVFYHGVMGVPEAVTNITLTKQAVNGITNVLIARLIFILIGFRATAFSITLREILHTCMVLCVALPLLILIIIDSRSDFEKGIAQTQMDLKNDALKINTSFQLWIKNRDAGMKSLALVAQLGDSARTQVALDQHRNSDLNILRVGLLSPSFVTTLYSPTTNEQGRSNVGVDFSDRSYVPSLREHAKPVLSDVMQSRLGSTVPIVAYLHPVIRDSQVKGYISGVLSLEQVSQSIADQVGASALRFTLIDRSGNVILTNREDQKPMTPFALGEGNFKKIADSISQWIPKIRANAPHYERFRKSYFLSESTLGLNSDWRLMLEQPVGPMQKALSETYTKRLTLLLMFLLLGTLLAELVGRKILKAFDALSESTADLPTKLSAGKKVEWPKSQMLETQNLIGNFQSMATSLQIEFAATREANALLEERVASRTAELTSSNAQLKLLETCVSRLNDIVLITEAEPVDQPGPRIVFVNDAFTRRTGYSREEAIGRTPRILQGPKTQRSELDRIGAALRRWEPVRAELINYTKAGQEFWIELDIVPIADAKGWYTHWVAVERDITERKLAEVALRTSEARRKVATDSGRVAIWEVDLKANQLIWDENCFTLYQIRKEDFKGTFEEWSRTIHPQDFDSVVLAFQAAVAGTTEYDLTFRIVWPNGEVRHIEAHGKVSRNGDGVPERMIGTNWDITSIKHQQEKLVQIAQFETMTKRRIEAANLELARSNSDLEQFAYVASHDLQEPLRSVASSVQLLKRRYAGALDARADEFIEHAIGGVKRMQVLIDDLLAYSRVASGPRLFSSVDLEGELKVVLDNLESSLAASTATVTHDPLPTLQANPLQIRQVLQNLIGNALKFRGDKPALVHIGAVRRDTEWQFSVADQGIGIAPEYFERVFKLFQRLHTRAEYEGTGIGLTICHKIVERHGGRIWVESAPGQGSTFFFTLPLEAEAA